MRFELREGFLIVVDGQIGSLEHLKFVLDTGASRTMVRTRLPADSPCPVRRARYSISTGKSRHSRLKFPPLRLGPILASGIRAMVGDVGQHSEFARDVDAIIALDVLARTAALRIDYDSKVVRFLQNSPT
jgi:Aspartyl protease